MNHVAIQLTSRSRFIQRVERRYPELLHCLSPGTPNLASIEKAYSSLLVQSGQDATGRTIERFTPEGALRVLRQLLLHRLCCLDCEPGLFQSGERRQQEGLQAICQAMTDFAEFAINTVHTIAWQSLCALHGIPRRSDGEVCEMWTIGMGKLGARELNVSSDIDVVFVYQEDGETPGREDGRGRLSHAEFFAKMARTMASMLADVQEHGFVFRVDLALRPNGNSGPNVISLRGLENYFQVQGREWERFAWLKSRVLAPWSAIQSGSAQALRGLVLPFVFRRYLDYAVFDSLRVLHQQIRSHASQRAAGRPERANDVKLSRGGIREIEFIVQLLQVVRGGQFPELRTRPTLGALPRLAKAGLIPEDAAQGLAQAYRFLRELEHRIQYLDDQQTHILPVDEGDLAAIAVSLGFNHVDDLLLRLGQVRDYVAQEFDALLGGQKNQEEPVQRPFQGQKGVVQYSEAGPVPSKVSGACASQPFSAQLGSLTVAASDWPAWLDAIQLWLEQQVEQAILARSVLEPQSTVQVWLQEVMSWAKAARIVQLREDARQRLMRLCAGIARTLAQESETLQAARRWLTWMETLVKRDSYLALLLERPAVQTRLLKLFAAAPWPLRFLTQYPGTIDELASDTMLYERFNPEQLRAELEARRESLRITQEDDDETLLNVLRRAHHAELLRTLVRDIEGHLTVEQVADDLSLLADTVLEVTALWCWQRLKQRHTDMPQFGIIGYGKLGGKELGYGSDLDIVFVYDDAHENAAELYGAFVRKLINWLSVKTAEGDLFEIDTSLRPNGNSGLLVTSMASYEKYQLSNGSNTAWTWEHQAITRARFVTGPASLAQRFETVRQAVLVAIRDREALRQEVLAMRERVRKAHPVPAGILDVKHSPGGMVDAEFVVQYLVLAYAKEFAELQNNQGNIALLEIAQRIGLLEAPLGQEAAAAYRALRKLQHQARLNEKPAHAAADQHSALFARIERLYARVLQPQAR